MGNKTKSLAAFALTIVITAALSGIYPAFAADNISVRIDGVPLIAEDANGGRVFPIERGGSTYLPVRAIGETFNKSVEWDSDTRTVYIGGRGSAAPSEVAEIEVFVDGRKIDPRDVNGKSVPLFILNGTTYVPVRAVAETFGRDVSWNQDKQEVVLVSPDYMYPWDKANEGDDNFRLIFTGAWDDIDTEHKKMMEYQFKNMFPKLIARWGTTGLEPKTVSFIADKSFTYDFGKGGRMAETRGANI